MWVTTPKGELVNLAQVAHVWIGYHADPSKGDFRRVRAGSVDGAGHGAVLFEGTPDECKQYILWLAGKLPRID